MKKHVTRFLRGLGALMVVWTVIQILILIAGVFAAGIINVTGGTTAISLRQLSRVGDIATLVIVGVVMLSALGASLESVMDKPDA